MKKIFIAIIIGLLIITFIGIPQIINRNNKKNILSENDKIVDGIDYKPVCYHKVNGKMQVTAVIKRQNGIESVSYLDEGKNVNINGYGKQKIGIDFLMDIENEDTKEIYVKESNGTTKTEIVNKNNLLDVENIDIFNDCANYSLGLANDREKLNSYGFLPQFNNPQWYSYNINYFNIGHSYYTANYSFKIRLNFDEFIFKKANTLFVNYFTSANGGSWAKSSTTVCYIDDTSETYTQNGSLKLKNKDIKYIEFNVWGWDADYSGSSGGLNQIKLNGVGIYQNNTNEQISDTTYVMNGNKMTFNKIISVGSQQNNTTIKSALDELINSGQKENVALVLDAGTYDTTDVFNGTSYDINPKYNGMNISIIADKPGEVNFQAGEIGMTETNINNSCKISFYRIIFVEPINGNGFHLNKDKDEKNYYNCVFNAPVGGWNGKVSNTKVNCYNCLFNKGGSNNYYYGSTYIRNGEAINCASTTDAIVPKDETLQTTCLKNVTIDSNYNITSSGWQNTGTGTNLDGTQANIGVYGGKYSW